MSITSFITELFRRGVTLSVQDGQLVIDAPKGLLQPNDVAMLRENRDSIIELLQSFGGDHGQVAVVRQSHNGRAETSEVQRSALIMHSLAQDKTYGNIPLAYSIEGELNKEALSDAFNVVIADHEILRTLYVQVDDDWQQIIQPTASLRIEWHDLSSSKTARSDAHLILQQAAQMPFDLAMQLPLRATLVKVADHTYILGMVFHQVAVDGHSCSLFMDLLSLAYAHGSIKNVAGTPYQFYDFVAWEARYKSTPQFLAAAEEWSKRLQGAPELHNLPTDFARPKILSFAGKTLEYVLTPNEFSLVEKFARSRNVGPFVVLQATMSALLARYSDSTDIVIGTAVANRTHAEFLNTLGNVVNTLPLRFDLSEVVAFNDLIIHVNQVISDALKRQQVPFNIIIEKLRPSRSAAYNPIVQIMLVLQEEQQSSLNLPGLTVRNEFVDPRIAKFDLTLHVYKQHGGAALRWEYNVALFREDTIATLAQHYKELLLNAIANPEMEITQIPLSTHGHAVSSAAMMQLPAAKCIDQWIDEQVKATPNAIAVVDGDVTISFAELNARAESMAAALRLLDSNSDQAFRVGLCIEKSIFSVIGFLAIMKAGGVYVPLDPTYPAARLEFMIQDSDLSVLVVDGHSPVPTDVRTTRIADLYRVSTDTAQRRVRSVNDVAYILYTSGSTGRPKGVLVPHRSLFYSLRSNANVIGIAANDVLPCIGSQAFGISILEILLPLTTGSTVKMLKQSQVRDIDQLISCTQDATVLHAVPSLMAKWLDRLQELPAKQYPTLKTLLVGGESVSDELLCRLREWRADIELIELYGMTESAVVCCSYRPTAEYAAQYCIGKPHPTSKFYVMNRYMQRQPCGVPGELYIGGVTLAAGYLNQPELTAEKFVDDPFTAGAWLYKTGDRVRELMDGKFEFLGRVDNQISLRGVRIEFGEIEALLATHPEVKASVAHVVTLTNGEKALVAYYTTRNSHADVTALSESLHAHLSLHLPDYMRPTVFQHLASFPLNPNGKVDRKALPAPTREQRSAHPANATETTLVGLWQGLLEIEIVGVETNFFEIGGNSLLATKLINQAKKHFDVELPVTALFEAPTVRRLAVIVDDRRRQKALSALLFESTDSTLEVNEILI